MDRGLTIDALRRAARGGGRRRSYQCAIGILVGWSVSAQQALFTQVPLSFNFPGMLVLTIFLVSLVCSFLATFAPVRALLRGSIVDTMRS